MDEIATNDPRHDDGRQSIGIGALIPAATTPAVRYRAPDTVYTLTMADMEIGIPSDFQGATLIAAVATPLNQGVASLALLGPPGTGKTRQAWAAVRSSRIARLRGRLGAPVSIPYDRAFPRPHWVRSQVLPDIVTIISESEDILRHRYDREWLDQQASIPHWLVVDDIGFAAPTEWAREAVYSLANVRRAHKRPTLWTSNLSPDEIKGSYSAAIASRILGGTVLELSGHDRRLA